VQYSDPEIYASHFDLDVICQATPPYNFAPSQPVVAIRQTREGKRELVPYCWILYAVSNVVNSPRNDGPELIESVEASHA